MATCPEYPAAGVCLVSAHSRLDTWDAQAQPATEVLLQRMAQQTYRHVSCTVPAPPAVHSIQMLTTMPGHRSSGGSARPETSLPSSMRAR